MNEKRQAAKIRELNDRLRKTGRGGRMMMTRGVQALGEKAIANIIAAIGAFDKFTKDNDPYGEHDFAKVVVDGVAVFFKVDYYDKGLEFASPNPADNLVTERVMTIMLTDEY